MKLAGASTGSWLRIRAVASKELGMLVRQPRLILLLLVGPVLIMVIFALSFHFQISTPSVAVVVKPHSQGAKLFERFRGRFRSQAKIQAVTGSEASAENLLQSGRVDGVVLIPPDPLSEIKNGHRATITVRYRSINPLYGTAVPNGADGLVRELNQAIVKKLIARELKAVRSEHQTLEKLNGRLDQIKGTAGALSSPQARQTTATLDNNLSSLENSLNAVQKYAPDGLGNRISGILGRVKKARKLLDDIRSAQNSGVKGIEKQAGVLKLDNELQALQKETGAIPKNVSASLLVNPFRLNLENLVRFQPTVVQFYAPGVLSLLIQHMALSLASLAIVREYLSGAQEFFEVSPLGNGELLVGKFLAYLIATLAANAAVAAALIWYLHIPINGVGLESLAVAMVLVSVASIGLGLLLSTLVRRELQAVQISMLILIASVFFAGFLFPLYLTKEPARGLSYILPSTYGIQAMQDAMLQNGWLSSGNFLGLALITVVSLGLTRLLIGRKRA